MHLLMLSCKKASVLIEKKLSFSLGTIEKMQLVIHTSMCSACKKYEQESRGLDAVLNNHIKTPISSTKDSSKLANVIKLKIINNLNNKK